MVAPELLDKLLKLPRDERSALAEALLVSLEDEPAENDDEVAEAWAREIERRVEANEPGVPAEAVFDELRTRL